MIKLIVTDLDGTLFRDNKTYSEEFKEIINKLKELGIIFVVCSGRQLFNIKKYFSEDLDIIYSGNNGTHFIVEEEEVFKVLSCDQIKKIIEIAKGKENHYLIGETKQGVIAERGVPDQLVIELKKYCENLRFIDCLSECKEEICKITVCCLEGAEQFAYPCYQELSSFVNVALSGDIWLDLMPLDGNKGNAVKAIQEKYQISPSETLVFGDHLNDVEMLHECPNSYAMRNAHPEAKRAAHYILEYDNNEDGVIKKIKEIVFSN